MMKLTCLGLALAAALCAPAIGQLLTQTLPAGFENTGGSTFSNFPFNTANDQIWQWHYDASNFAASSEISIREIYVRAANSTDTVQAFSFPSVEITMIEASTDWTAHDVDFADNVVRSEIVRTGSWTSTGVAATGGTTAEWIPLGLARPFAYDPTSGNDLIIQVRKCGTTTPWGASIDTASGAITGMRGGHRTDCNAAAEDFRNASAVPVARIDYLEVETQSLPSGLLTTSANSSSSWPVNTTDDQTWQWHYDSTEFAAGETIAITELFLRPSVPGATVQAFDFPSFEVTMITASTDYRVGSHDPVFLNNVLTQQVVKTGRWSGNVTPPSINPGGTFIALQLDEAYLYNPSNGRDLIVQVRSCAPAVPWGTALDVELGSSIGGNRYGHRTDCAAAAEDFSNNEAVPALKLNYIRRTVTSFPWVATFDEVMGAFTEVPPPGWTQIDSDGPQDWAFTNSATSSSGTGPFADHTTGIPGHGSYAYLEDSGNEASLVFLFTPLLDLGALANPHLQFWISSRNSNTTVTENRLTIDISGPTGIVSNVASFGDLGTQDWQPVDVDLSAFAGDRILVRFNGRTNNGTFTHDIAIDDIRVYDHVVPPGQAPQGGATLDVNDALNVNGLSTGSGEPGPYFAEAHVGDRIDILLTGASEQPVVLLAGPLNPGLITYPGIGQFDIGSGVSMGAPTGLVLIGDGTNPTFPNALYRTNALGEMLISFPTPSSLLGTSFTLQALAFTGGPTVVALSDAVQTAVVP